jgi:hypothetical protein
MRYGFFLPPGCVKILTPKEAGKKRPLTGVKNPL